MTIKNTQPAIVTGASRGIGRAIALRLFVTTLDGALVNSQIARANGGFV